MKPMHIAFFTDGIYPCVMGGMQKHSYNLIKHLAQNKIRVTVYHVVNYEQQQSLHYHNYFTTEELAFITFNSFQFPTGKSFIGHYLYYSYQYSKLLAQYFVQHKTTENLVFAKGFSAWYLLAHKKQLGITLPIVVKFHGLEMWQRAASFTEKLKQYLLRPAVAYNLRKATAVISYGGNISTIIQQRGVAINKIINIPTGIDSAWISLPRTQVNTARKIVFVGRYERRKGIEELHQAIQQLQQNEQLNCQFHFVGPIPITLQLKFSNCVYHGSITEARQLQQLLCTTDLLICPSYAEGMPNVILEGMASGNAVIATNVGAINTMVSSVNGWLMPNCNVTTICKTLQQALTIDNEKLLQQKNNSIVIAQQQFNWDTLVKHYIAAFDKLITIKI